MTSGTSRRRRDARPFPHAIDHHRSRSAVRHRRRRRRRQALTWHFARHYLEMLLSMVAGMVVFGWLENFLPFDVMARGDVGAMVMATNMSLGMAAWMKFRGHSWRGIAEMCAAMYVPFAVLLVPFWVGAISGDLLMTAGHVLMLPAMALVMLWRPCEYGG